MRELFFSLRMNDHPPYLTVFFTFARNSLVRDMTFRSNFLIQAFSSLSWMLMNLGFYILVYEYTQEISDWTKYEFFAFMATTMMVNSLVQTFFMPNAAEFSELIRRGGLDFLLIKPIDTQFLISLSRVEWSHLSNFLFGTVLMGYALYELAYFPPWPLLLIYPVFLVCGSLILYSLMMILASTSIWLGRNQSLYDFWFYITNFSRYPMEIYEGTFGTPIQYFFTYLIPILVVVNIPARVIVKPLHEQYPWLMIFTLLATAVSLFCSRMIFYGALSTYRSASS